jgi:outer membrane protein TolC
LKDAFSFKYKNWSIGFTLDIPINNIIGRAALAQAKVNLEQSILQMKSQEQEIFTDIKIAVRGVETNYKRIQAYKAARELAEKQLEAEEEKLKVGLTTNYFVLQYQNSLANAQSQELRAIIDYNLSLASLNRDLGISLQQKNIKITDVMGR